MLQVQLPVAMTPRDLGLSGANISDRSLIVTAEVRLSLETLPPILEGCVESMVIVMQRLPEATRQENHPGQPMSGVVRSKCLRHD